MIKFSKWNGAGNDFIFVDNRAGTVRLSREQVARLCHRQRGIGADGLMLLVPGAGRAPWAWDFFNSDGSAADMCGNGARCFARYLRGLTGATDGVAFETGAGVIAAKFDGNRVTVNLTPPHGLRLNESVALASQSLMVHSLNTGVPHTVVFVPDADLAMVQQLGHAIRCHPHFAPKGTNVNFVQLLGPGHIRVRTYERGVEGETLACGTGVSASAMITSRVHGFAPPVRVQVQGGDQLEVDFKRDGDSFADVRLTGPAEFVFEGTIEV